MATISRIVRMSPQGASGPPPNFQVGTVTTGAPGSEVVVEITGTTPNFTLNLSIPAGANGVDGEDGDDASVTTGAVKSARSSPVYHRFATLADASVIAQGAALESGGTWKRDIRGVEPTIVGGALAGAVGASLALPEANTLYYYFVESGVDVTRIAVDVEFLPPRVGTATLTFSGNALNTQTVSIGPLGSQRTYTFRTSLTGAANEVLIGGSAAASRDNLVAAINAAAGAGTTYGTGTVACEYGYAAASGGNMVFTSNHPTIPAASIVLLEVLGNAAWSSATPLPGANQGGLIIALANAALDNGGAGTPGVANLALKHGMLHFEMTQLGIKQCQIRRDPADPLNPAAGGITFDPVPAERQAVTGGAYYAWGGDVSPVTIPFRKRVRLTLEIKGSELSATCMGWTVRFRDAMFASHTVGRHLYFEALGDQLSSGFRVASRPVLHALWLNGEGFDDEPGFGKSGEAFDSTPRQWNHGGAVALYGDTGAKVSLDNIAPANTQLFVGASPGVLDGAIPVPIGGHIVSETGSFSGNVGTAAIGGAVTGRTTMNLPTAHVVANSSAAGAETSIKAINTLQILQPGECEEWFLPINLVGASAKRIRVPWAFYGGNVFDSNVAGTPLDAVSGPALLHIQRYSVTGASHWTIATFLYPGGALPPQILSSNLASNYTYLDFRTTTVSAGGVVLFTHRRAFHGIVRP